MDAKKIVKRLKTYVTGRRVLSRLNLGDEIVLEIPPMLRGSRLRIKRLRNRRQTISVKVVPIDVDYSKPE